VPRRLGYELHKLTARLDRFADGLLREAAGVSYARFLALFAVRECGGTQRDMARWLGLSEPSASRMVRVLADDGLLEAKALVGRGNRRQVQLTAKGDELVDRCGELLEARFEELVKLCGVDYRTYQNQTRRLLDNLEAVPAASLPRQEMK
jgi:MarR family transcriptional regulator, organic hydroperoxide resistance regulator